MKQFNSLSAAISYHSNCIICNTKLKIAEQNFIKSSTSVYINNNIISFYLSSNSNNLVSINLDTDEVILSNLTKKIGHYTNKFQGTIGSYTTTNPSNNIINGMFLQRLILDCNKCCQFFYTLQIHIDLGLSKLIGVFLNSETLTFKDEDSVHEIRNIYSTEKTEYTFFPPNGAECKEMILPLIPLDYISPQKNIDRVRKLLIFS